MQTWNEWAYSDTLRDNATFVVLEDPKFGTIRMPPLACDLGATPGRVLRTEREIDVSEVGWDVRTPAERQPVFAESSPLRMPLDGVRVLDLGAFVASPFAASILCDLGADVVKVEPPQGDDYRVYGASFVAVHQGKRGVRIDLKSPVGRAQLGRFANSALGASTARSAMTLRSIHCCRPGAGSCMRRVGDRRNR